MFVCLKFLKHSPSRLNPVTCGWLNTFLQTNAPQTENSPREISFCPPCKPRSFHSGLHICTHPGLSWRGKVLFDLTPQLPANLQSSTATSSAQQHEQSHALSLSEKANMNYGEEITTLFQLPFLAAGGIPTMSPWKLWSFLSGCLRADNAVHQQHLLPQFPPPVLAALGLYSRNVLHHILPHRKGMAGTLCWSVSTFSMLMLRHIL